MNSYCRDPYQSCQELPLLFLVLGDTTEAVAVADINMGRQVVPGTRRRVAPDDEHSSLLDFAPWAEDLHDVQDEVEDDLRVMRDQVYSLSKALGEAQSGLRVA